MQTFFSKDTIILLFFLSGMSGSTLLAQDDKFVCNGDLIITLSGGPSTNAHSITLDGAMASFSSLANFSIAINSSGFNSVDGYIYGITQGEEIIRLKRDGSYDNLGRPVFLPTGGISAAGDFDKNGIYWIHHRGDQSYYGIDVNNGNTLVDKIELQWHPSSGNSGKFEESIDDFVFDPLEPTDMYTYQRGWNNFPINGDATVGHLLRADLDPSSDTYGYIFSEGKLDLGTITHLGAMFFDSQGFLFGYGDNSPSGIVSQNRLVKIDLDPAAANLVAIGPGASANDGCSCPFSMFVTKRTPDSYNVCFGEPIEVTYEIGNNSNVNPNGAIFTDTFPTGFVIEDIIFEEEFGILRSGTGIGTNKIIIDSVNVINKIVSFRAIIRPSLVSETYKIYANLSNLPLRFGSVIYSDDPETFASNDPTIFVVDYQQFQEDFDIGADITMCEGETASFSASSPLPNTNILWNTGAVGNFASTTQPGLVIATAELGVCSDIDTALVTTLPYPVVVLDSIYRPCHDDTEVILSVPENSEYVYNWNTGAEEPAITITESGTYEIAVDNQGCMTSASTVVDFVFEEFTETFADTALCEGESIDYIVSNDLPVNYLWTLPDGTQVDESSVSLHPVTYNDAGTFTIFMEYEECVFETDFSLDLLASPELELASEINYDVCDSLTVNIDEVTPGSNIQWSPADIFDCQNCETNTAMTITDQTIIVTATNEIGCATHDTLLLNIEDIGRGQQTHIPNIFSPNGDRNNDFFVVVPLCYRIEKFQIFDRWGNSVYKFRYNLRQDYVEWNGNNHVGSCTEGVYTWVGEFTYINSGQTKTMSGDVTIIR